MFCGASQKRRGMRAKNWSGPSGCTRAPNGEGTKHPFVDAFLTCLFLGMHLVDAPGMSVMFKISKTALVLYILLTPSPAPCWTFQTNIPNPKTSATLHGSAPAKKRTSATLHGNGFCIFMIQIDAPNGSPKNVPNHYF